MPVRRSRVGLLAILALLLGQAGAQLHDLAHLKHDLAVVRYGEQKTPPLGHSIEVCAAYAVICHSVGHSGIWHILAAGAPAVLPVLFVFFLPRALRVEFDPRAPPAPASL
ncbi:MAG TPA: hypothetical protein VLX30_15890 [Burkholderiales bacterium]|nr:hypothetical protein [Burkholderiales bacterium]